MVKKKVVAIVPAFNEEANVKDVLSVLLKSKYLDEVILVDDGSEDKTSEVGKKLGAKVIRLSVNGGKGNAMRRGIESTDAKIIVFFDADLIGLTESHIFSLIDPLLKDEADMCVGIRNRILNIPKILIKMDPLFAIGGERAIKRDVLKNIPEKFTQGFAVEIALDYYCIKNKLIVKYVDLSNLSIIIKEVKWGLFKGFLNRIKMIWQMIEIRIKILFYKNESI
jgi:glycosyltransferase involved in cell wall biosynthesis